LVAIQPGDMSTSAIEALNATQIAAFTADQLAALQAAVS
jgi:hypothetical protein